MNRRAAAVLAAALALSALAGCGGKGTASGSPCRDAYVTKIDDALTALEKAPPNTDFDTALGNAVGADVPEPCKELAQGLVEDIVSQVFGEQADRMAKLEGKFPAPSASPEESSGSGSESPGPDESGSPAPSKSPGSSADESSSPSPTG